MHPLHRLKPLADFWFPDQPLKPSNNFQNVLIDNIMPNLDQTLTQYPLKPKSRSNSRSQSRSSSPAPAAPDVTAAFSDEILLRVLRLLPDDCRDSAATLVCKRWLRLTGRLRRCLTLRRWQSLERLLERFPNLNELDLVPAAFASTKATSLSGSGLVMLSRGSFSIQMDQQWSPPVGETPLIDSNLIDQGLATVARCCPNLRKLSVAGSEAGLVAVGDACDTLQEMELHRCSDLTLRSISGFKNLQILKLVGSVEGLYSGPGVSDIGLTILAHGCKRLVKLELSGCEGSYDGISAIGRCCLMLEELTLCDHRMDAGWMAGLSFCGNLKTLRLQSCKKIDKDPGPLEHLGSCPTIERIQMQRCQLRDRISLKALFTMCKSAREIVFQNCWGLDDEMFGLASICR